MGWLRYGVCVGQGDVLPQMPKTCGYKHGRLQLGVQYGGAIWGCNMGCNLRLQKLVKDNCKFVSITSFLPKNMRGAISGVQYGGAIWWLWDREMSCLGCHRHIDTNMGSTIWVCGGVQYIGGVGQGDVLPEMRFLHVDTNRGL